MPKTSDMYPSKYLKQEDVGTGKLLTITAIDKVNVGLDGEPEQWKWAMYFAEMEKPLILNVTNIERAETACGSNDTDDWKGKQIVLYTDPDIMFGGKKTGGIRVRTPKNQQPPEEKDDLPF